MDNIYDEEKATLEVIKRPDLIFQQERASVDIQVATAHMYPRNLTKCIKNAITTVQLSAKIAESCTFSLPRGGKTLSGPSVHLAKIMAQNWGNLRVQNKTIEIGLKNVTSQAICWDLENNLAVQTEVKRSIMKGNGERYDESMILVTCAAANSISLRNAVFAVIPSDIVDKVYSASKRMILGKVDTKELLMAKQREIVGALKDVYGVTEQEILKTIGKNAIDNLTDQDLIVLTGFGTALKEGESTVEQLFRGAKNKLFEAEGNPSEDRIITLINNSKTIEELKKHEKFVKTLDASRAYDNKLSELKC